MRTYISPHLYVCFMHYRFYSENVFAIMTAVFANGTELAFDCDLLRYCVTYNVGTRLAFI